MEEHNFTKDVEGEFAEWFEAEKESLDLLFPNLIPLQQQALHVQLYLAYLEGAKMTVEKMQKQFGGV